MTTSNFCRQMKETRKPRFGKSSRHAQCDALPLRIHGRWMVLNERLFVLDTYSSRADRTEVEVISSDGQVKFRSEMAKHESADTVRASERGDRIALHVLTLRGGNRTLDIDSHVTARRIGVYDIEARKEVASISVSPKYHHRFAFDISPDGQHLAILEDDVMKVVALGITNPMCIDLFLTVVTRPFHSS
jgi:hypothetical protein